MSQFGELCVLNCGRGDFRIGFTRGDTAAITEARKVIQDMMQRGYLLMVEQKDGTYRRVRKFDARKLAYVLVKDGTKPSARKIERVPVRKRKMVAVAPTAGG